MDDPHRAPKDRDRDPLVARIERVAELGLIGAADRDIRIGNVRAARSMNELALIGRDLDLLEQTVTPAGPPVAPTPQVSFESGGAAAPAPAWDAGSSAGEAASVAAKRFALVFFLVATLAVAGAAVFAVVAFSGGGSSSVSSGVLFDPLESGDPTSPEDPVAEDPDPQASPGPGTSVPADEPAEPYALTAPGIRAFLAAYREKFGTARVTTLTMYDDYVVVRVPVPGKKRHAGWLYRPGNGWSEFGGVSADFPGSAVIDTSRLDIGALIRNIARARRTLAVEDYTITYVNLDFRPDFDESPNVNIYVSNEFRESGYLATTLDGRVERTYPYSS